MDAGSGRLAWVAAANGVFVRCPNGDEMRQIAGRWMPQYAYAFAEYAEQK
jgi:hypothetical protein